MKKSLLLGWILMLGISITLLHGGYVSAAEKNVLMLTDAYVQKFLKVFPLYMEWIRKHSDLMDKVADKSDAFQMIQVAQSAKDHEAFFKKQGWTFEEFLLTSQQVLTAYAALQAGEGVQEGRKEFEEQREKAIQEIKKDPDLSPEQKKMMLQQMGQAEESMKKAEELFKNVPPANIKLVKKHREAIAKALEGMD